MDPDGQWWQWWNGELGHHYQDLWEQINFLIMIKVPDIETVIDSRWRQEQNLAHQLTNPHEKRGLMSRDEIKRFVMHYERLTLHVLKEVPALADVVIHRDKNFHYQIVSGF